MKTMKIFEPAMCCPTGLCGVSVDPELLRVSTVLNTLKENGVEVQRYNLTSVPAEFVKHKAVTEYLQKFGPEKLPVILVEDVIVIAGRYPTNEEFTSWLDLSADVLGAPCCGGNTSCCCEGEASAEEGCCCGGDAPAEEGCCCGGDAPAEEGCCCGGDAPAEEGCCCGGDAPAKESCCGEGAPSNDCCCGDGCC